MEFFKWQHDLVKVSYDSSYFDKFIFISDRILKNHPFANKINFIEENKHGIL